jgi:16S rRNA (uracil1498-N3)-methyltransferase
MRDCEHYLFYSDGIAGDTIVLDGEESNHAVSVLRIKVGQRIRITDGGGSVYECLCTDIRKQSMLCTIMGKASIPRVTPELTLLVGLPDKERFETILEHVTALGVYRVVPLVMDHCRKPWWESWDRLRQRFTLKMIASMKQCLYPYVPRLDAPASLDGIIDTCERPIVVADQYGKRVCDTEISSYKKLTCVVGPPGGMSDDESRVLESREPLVVAVAPARLRTELAVAVMCSRVID